MPYTNLASSSSYSNYRWIADAYSSYFGEWRGNYVDQTSSRSDWSQIVCVSNLCDK